MKALLARAAEIWALLRFDPGKARLAWWFAAVNVATVVIVVGIISVSATGMLRTLADGQGKSRVQLAGAMAREDLRRAAEDVVTAAHVLAERPTLERLVAENRPDDITAFLRRSCQTSSISACAVFADGRIIARVGPPLPWDAIVTASAEQGESFLAVPTGAKSPLLGAVVALHKGGSAAASALEPEPLPALPAGGTLNTPPSATVEAPVAAAGTAPASTTAPGSTPGAPRGPREARVFVVRLLDGELAHALSQQVGLDVRLVNYRSFTAAPVDEFTALHSAALADGRSAVQRISKLDLYASSVPVFASTGEAIALIETRLPTADLDTAAAQLAHRLQITALVLAILAVIAGVTLGQLIAGPVQALTDAAVRLGQGDFSTSIPTSGAAEVGALARTMEDMRRNLVDLTNTLRRREAEAQAVLAGIVEGVYAVDKNRNIRYLNPQAAKLLGVEASKAVGQFCGDLLKPAPENGRRPCEYRCPILQARTDGTAHAIEHLQPTPDSARTTVITSAGMVDGLQVQVIRDETELEAVRRARDSVLANISHEFRTPLAAQLASIELLREGLETMQPHERAELVLSLERGTVRLTRLIDNLLESVRIESGQLSIRRQSVDLAEILEDVRGLIGSLLALRGQRLDVQLPPELPPVEGDALRLTQVFVNLLANASKFAPEGSVVRVGAVPDGAHVIAWVEDEGPGVPQGDGASIFDRFQRGAAEEPEHGGLGLGLWIVKSIVARHGGTIDVSRTADERTRFSVTLPAETSE